MALVHDDDRDANVPSTLLQSATMPRVDIPDACAAASVIPQSEQELQSIIVAAAAADDDDDDEDDTVPLTVHDVAVLSEDAYDDVVKLTVTQNDDDPAALLVLWLPAVSLLRQASKVVNSMGDCPIPVTCTVHRRSH